MRALVTGAAGFVGRHMTEALLVRGYEVDWCDPAWASIVGRPLRGGVPGTPVPPLTRTYDDAHDLFREEQRQYDLVVHAAAAGPHRAAIDGRPMNLATNLMLDAAMFDWAVRTEQRRVLYLSSSAAYPIAAQQGQCQFTGGTCDGRQCRGGLHEDLIRIDLETLGLPDAAYGWTKLTGERLAAAASQAGLAVHVVRPFSGYGEDQSLDFPFPSIVQRARAGNLSVWGPPGQTRDWIYISDVVNGALAVVDADERRPVNLCTGIGTEMGDLALMVARTAGLDPVGGVEYQEDKPTGVMHRVGDPSRMNQHYTAQVSIEEGVARALAKSAAQLVMVGEPGPEIVCFGGEARVLPPT